ncbi:MAG: hypothetical protein ACRDQA_23525 [Nocardioidaceae bacterium]
MHDHDQARHAARGRRHPGWGRFALAAGFVGLCYAAISVYWGVGGTLLLDTIGGLLERGGRAGARLQARRSAV